MIRINLLPHREQRRAERRNQFFAFLGLMAVLGVVTGAVVHMYISAQIEQQEARNHFIEAENAALDKQIAEIRRLKEQIDALLARKLVIESLQSTRGEPVRLFNELASQMPESVYLTNVKQTDLNVMVAGYAQSNARVSTLMRNLDGSPYLKEPQLIETKVAILTKNDKGQMVLVDPNDSRATDSGARRVSRYGLNVKIERPETDKTEETK
ncbi:MAG: PilN domain-containing protein [Rhodocyclaceae bacterium]|nr:PilN domain-containing protein [Rhodocyclaceae bacterium]